MRRVEMCNATKGKKPPLPPAGNHEQVYETYVTRVSSELAGVKSTKELEEVDFEKNPANKIIVAELEERRKRHNELVQLHEQEKAKLEKLYADSSQWYKSQKLRSYIEAVRQKAVQADGKILPGSELEDWIKWAHQQADRMDPLVESPHSILDEKVPNFWNWP